MIEVRMSYQDGFQLQAPLLNEPYDILSWASGIYEERVLLSFILN
jgi:hypothetical protein